MCLKITARSAGLLPALVLNVLSAPSWRSFSTASSLPYCTAIDKAWHKILAYTKSKNKFFCTEKYGTLFLCNFRATAWSAHWKELLWQTKLTHRVSTAILDIDICPMGGQQVDDLTVAIPGSQHQTCHLRPEKSTNNKKAIEEMKKRGDFIVRWGHQRRRGENKWRQEWWWRYKETTRGQHTLHYR